MAPLPNPRTPSDVYMHDIAVSLRQLAGRPDDEPSGQVALREPVQGVDATPTVHTSKGKLSDDGEPKGDGNVDNEPSGDRPFDPSDHSVDEVNAYLADADDAERARVLAAEKAGKHRKTVKSPEAAT